MRKNSDFKKAVLDFLFLVGVIRLDWISNMDEQMFKFLPMLNQDVKSQITKIKFNISSLGERKK